MNTLVSEFATTTSFKLEWFGYDRNRQRTQFTGDIRYDRRSTRTGSASHPGGDENHVRPFERFTNFVLAFFGCLFAHFRVAASAKPPSEVCSKLNLLARLGFF